MSQLANFVRASLSALVFTIAAAGCSRSGQGSSAAFGSGLPEVRPSREIRGLEHAMFARLNRDRKERGLPALTYDERVASVARFHSSDMRGEKFFAHESPTTGSLDDRLNRAGYLFLTARENLVEAPDVQSGQDSLLESPGHYANIVATDITTIGIGIVKGGVEEPENLLVTQVFTTPGRKESPAAAQAALVTRIQQERAKQGLPRAETYPLLNELAQKHISELDAETSPSSLKSVAKSISQAVAEANDEQLRGVAVAAQLLPDTRSFEVPSTLLTRPKARFGLAVRTTSGPGGRPMVQLLLLVSQ